MSFAAHRIFWHGDFPSVLRSGVSGVPHPPYQNQTEAETQPELYEQDGHPGSGENGDQKI